VVLIFAFVADRPPHSDPDSPASSRYFEGDDSPIQDNSRIANDRFMTEIAVSAFFMVIPFVEGAS